MTKTFTKGSNRRLANRSSRTNVSVQLTNRRTNIVSRRFYNRIINNVSRRVMQFSRTNSITHISRLMMNVGHRVQIRHTSNYNHKFRFKHSSAYDNVSSLTLRVTRVRRVTIRRSSVTSTNHHRVRNNQEAGATHSSSRRTKNRRPLLPFSPRALRGRVTHMPLRLFVDRYRIFSVFPSPLDPLHNRLPSREKTGGDIDTGAP